MKTFITFILASFLSLGAMAESDIKSQGDRQHRQPPSPEKMVARMTEELSLSSEQAEQITAILEGSHEQIKASRENVREIHQQTHQKISEVLTPEQQETFDANREKRREKMQQHREQRQQP